LDEEEQVEPWGGRVEDDGYNDAVDDRGWWLTAASTWSTVGSELMVADKCFQMAHNASSCKFQIHESVDSRQKI